MAALLAAFAVGCGEEQATPGWRVRFGAGVDPAEVATVRLVVARDGCGGAADYRALVGRGERAPGFDSALPPGRYGFLARARDASCRYIAEGCTTVTLPRDEDIVVTLAPGSAQPPACSAAECDGAGRCPGEPGYGGPSGGGEPDGDGPRRDAGSGDAGDGCGPCAVPAAGGRCDGTPREGAPCSDSSNARGSCYGGRCCAGCWDGTACQDGTSEAACGAGGARCEACGPCERCAGGRCEPLDDRSPCTGSGGASGRCVAGACCTGCVSMVGTCLPVEGQDFGGCGLGGADCRECSGSQVCCSGTCAGSCS